MRFSHSLLAFFIVGFASLTLCAACQSQRTTARPEFQVDVKNKATVSNGKIVLQWVLENIGVQPIEILKDVLPWAATSFSADYELRGAQGEVLPLKALHPIGSNIIATARLAPGEKLIGETNLEAYFRGLRNLIVLQEVVLAWEYKFWSRDGARTHIQHFSGTLPLPPDLATAKPE
jgi:hypothetical protein